MRLLDLLPPQPVLDAVLVAATWLLTYAAHGALAGALALAAGPRIRAPERRDLLWKAALLLPLLSATLAVVRPVSMRDVRMTTIASHLAGSLAAPRVERDVRAISGAPRIVTERVVDLAALLVALPTLLVAVGAGGHGIVALARRRRELARALHGRAPVDAARVAALALPSPAPGARGRDVRITAAPGLTSPVALRGHEICVPALAFWSLTPTQRRSVVAHELAHLERRDPHWLALADVLQGVLAFRPLGARLVAALRRDAEFACDARAARAVGDPRPLVESLAALARPFDRAAMSTAVGYDGSPIVERARRLLAPEAASPVDGRRAVLAIGALAAALLLGAPSLSITARRPRADGPTVRETETVTVQRDTVGRAP